jgi:AraC-like DNA-binding protein
MQNVDSEVVIDDGRDHVAIPAWTVFAAGLDPGAFRTWCALAVYATNGSFPNIDDIAAELGIHRTTLYRQLDDLEGRGLIRRHRWRRPNGQPAVRYELAWSHPLAEAS